MMISSHLHGFFSNERLERKITVHWYAQVVCEFSILIHCIIIQTHNFSQKVISYYKQKELVFNKLAYMPSTIDLGVVISSA